MKEYRFKHRYTKEEVTVEAKTQRHAFKKGMKLLKKAGQDNEIILI